MNILKKILYAVLTIIILSCAFYFFYLSPRYVVPVLMYHSIEDNPESTLSVSPENFAKQIKFLRDNKYSVISLGELVRGIKEGRKFDHNTVVVTFDDGFEDNYLKAFPILARYRIPASVFLVSGYMGNKKGYLNWDQVRLMNNNGIDFGGHTRTEVYLPAVKDTEKLWEEIALCREDIKNNAGFEPDFFCYPTGGFNDKIKDTIKKAGYKGACTTNRGKDRFNKDVYEINRVKVTDSDMNKPFHFRAKLSGYYNLFRTLRNGE
ncbi:MAG: polysaccharide deacetylase family protein [Candidatus Omnitrophota bacterium]